jgi:hypothetical protein
MASSAGLNGIPQRELDRLFGAPPDEFVAARKEVARRLADDGREEEAEQVRALRKPSLPTWAANQVARQAKKDVKRLLDATARVRKVQGEGRGDFAAARGDLDSALDDLVGAARAAIEGAGKKATESTLRRVEQTLRGAATTEPDDLRRGALTQEVEPAGFEALLGSVPAGGPRRAPTPSRPAPSEVAEARRRLSSAREAARERAKAAREAERTASTALKAWERARDEAERAGAELEQAEALVAEAEQRLEELR